LGVLDATTWENRMITGLKAWASNTVRPRIMVDSTAGSFMAISFFAVEGMPRHVS